MTRKEAARIAYYEKRKAILAGIKKVRRRGDVDKHTGLVFFQYHYLAKKCEVWLTREKFDARIALFKKHGKSENTKRLRAQWKARKYIQDPLYKLSALMRSRMKVAFRRKSIRRSAKTAEILGADTETIRAWIERQFTDGMTWDNAGTYWHIDHMMPLCMAKTDAEMIQLCHYTNLRPMVANDNLKRPRDGSDLYSPWPRVIVEASIPPNNDRT